MSTFSEEEQIRQLIALIQRKQDLLDRKFYKDLQIIKLKYLKQQITDAEASLKRQKVLAAYADSLIKRSTFRERFCKFYNQHQTSANVLETYAEIAFTVITSINPI